MQHVLANKCIADGLATIFYPLAAACHAELLIESTWHCILLSILEVCKLRNLHIHTICYTIALTNSSVPLNYSLHIQNKVFIYFSLFLVDRVRTHSYYEHTDLVKKVCNFELWRLVTNLLHAMWLWFNPPGNWKTCTESRIRNENDKLGKTVVIRGQLSNRLQPSRVQAST